MISPMPMIDPMTLMMPLATCAVIELDVDMPAYSRTFGA